MPSDYKSKKEFPRLDSGWRLDGPIHAERHVKVICIGAGASGLLLAYKLQRHFENVDLTIYEKNSEISGTWWENKYPGCACDLPSHNYTFSFEPNPEWESVYAGSAQILQYFKKFAQKYDLNKYVKTKHQVTGAYWNVEKAGWDIKIQDLDAGKEIEDFCDIFINASGVLNHWSWPDIQGLNEFKGVLLHTAKWDEEVKLDGKHVGLIGNGSSGIQVLPTIQPIVKKLTTFIRSPTWVAPAQGQAQHIFTEKEKKDFATKPGVLTAHRKKEERSLNSIFSLFLKEHALNKATEEHMIGQMKEKLGNVSLEEKLIPKFKVGCRRFTPGVGYLEALSKENVEVVHGGISRITEKGCVTESGKEYELDVLICATGFDCSFRPRFPIVGLDGKNLQDEWKDEPKAYFGLAAAGFPNYLMFVGPNSPVGNGPVLSAIEVQADYMLKLINHYQTHTHSTFTPSAAAVASLTAHKDAFMTRTVWTSPCRSWYKSGTISGPVTALWPGSTLHYIEAISEIRFEDWEIGYKQESDRYKYLGNGYGQIEMDETADIAWYIGEKDVGPPLSAKGKRAALTGAVVRDGYAWKFEVANGEDAKAHGKHVANGEDAKTSDRQNGRNVFPSSDEPIEAANYLNF